MIEPVHDAQRPYRVALVAACAFPTLQGSQLLVQRLAQGLVARGHEVVVVTYSEGLEEALGGIRVRRAPRLLGCRAVGSGPRAAKLALDVALLGTLLRVLRSEGIDLVHAHNYEAALVGLAAGKALGVPVIYHSHNALAEELPTYFRSRLVRRAARALGAVVDRVVPRRADHCIAICHELVGYLRQRGVADGAIAMIPPGGSPEEFPTRSREEMRAVRERFGFGDRPVLFYAGNLDGYQNLELLLASFRLVRVAVPEALLVLATHAAPRSVPPALRPASAGVRLLATENFATVRDLLQAADVALCPRSEWSGFPMKLLNYLAAGKPVVASTGSAKALRHRVNGWIVSDPSPHAYAGAIVRLLRDPALRAALGAAGRRTVEDEYGWGRVIDQVEATYDRVMERRTAARAARRGGRPSARVADAERRRAVA